MSRYLKVLIVTVALVTATATVAFAADSASFNVTVSVAAEASIEVVSGGPIVFGTMSVNDSAVSTSAIVVKNNGSGSDQTYSLALANPSGWTAVTSTPGLDEYRLCAAFDSDGSLTWSPANHALTTTPTPSSGTKFAGDQTGTAVPYNVQRKLYLRMETSSATSSPSQKTIQVTITAAID